MAPLAAVRVSNSPTSSNPDIQVAHFANAAGGAAIGTSSPRITPLPTVDSVAAAAAVGTVVTRTGESLISLQTPLIVEPGRFVHVGVRILQVPAAITSGAMSGGIGFSGFMD